MPKIDFNNIKGRVVLAPMAGYTSFGYRKFMNPFGVAFCYTEMVSDMGLIYGNKETLSYIDFDEDIVPTGVQLFGSDPDNLAKALLIVEKNNPNVSFYDINMACPVNKVVKTGAGSFLLNDPKKCGDIVRKLKSVTDKPITAKIRLGWDDKNINYLEVIKELEEAGVSLIAIHARTRKELYYGEPHYELLKDLQSKMSVPLAVSGNIFTVEDALKALNITGAKFVMLARGAVGNPRLISNINKALNNEEYESPTLVEQINYCKELAKSLIEEKGEAIAMRVFRSISPRFFTSFPNSKYLRNALASQVSTYQEFENILNEYLLSFDK